VSKVVCYVFRQVTSLGFGDGVRRVGSFNVENSIFFCSAKLGIYDNLVIADYRDIEETYRRELRAGLYREHDSFSKLNKSFPLTFVEILKAEGTGWKCLEDGTLG
jgi:hypothetical protein